MFMKLTFAAMIGCLTLQVQETSLQRDSSKSLGTAKAENQAAATVPHKGNRESQLVHPKGYLEVYSLRNSDSSEVTKTLQALNLEGVRIVNEDKHERRVHVLANSALHKKVAELIKKLDGRAEGDSSAELAEESPAKRRFMVTVSLVHKGWTKELSNNESALNELQKLYEGVDVSALGGELKNVAHRLIFPEDRAAIFDLASFANLHARLNELKLVESAETVPVEGDEPETFGPYSFERIHVQGVRLPPMTRLRSNSDQGPFTKQVGSWSIGIGTDSRSENSVICDRKFTQHIETNWPTRTKQVDRQTVGSKHFGSRFDLQHGEVAVLRWPDDHASSKTLRMMMGSGGSPPAIGKSAKVKGAFPIIVIAHGDDVPARNPAQAGWSKPLKTAALQRFDYTGTVQALRRSPSQFDRLFSATGRAGNSERGNRSVASTSGGDEKPNVLKKVFHLQQIDVSEAAKLIALFLGNESDLELVMTPVVRTNSLLVSGSDEAMDMIEDILETLDVPSTNTKKAADAKGKSVQMQMGPAGTMILKGSKDNVEAAEQMLSQMSSQQLSERSKELEGKAASWLEQYPRGGDANKKDLEELKRTVTEDFDVRQRLQLAEIEFLKARLDDLERRVRQKEKLKSLIIDRRIEALLSKPSESEKKNQNSLSR